MLEKIGACAHQKISSTLFEMCAIFLTVLKGINYAFMSLHIWIIPFFNAHIFFVMDYMFNIKHTNKTYQCTFIFLDAIFVAKSK